MDINNVLGVNSENISSIISAKKSNLETEDFQTTLNNAIENGQDEELKEACVEFESYFLNMMFKSMRSSIVSGGGMFEKSNAEKLFQEMLDQEVSKTAANQGGIGLADMMYKQLERKNNAIDIEA